MATFESIFASNTDTNPDLDALFKKTTKLNPTNKTILDAIKVNETDDTPTPTSVDQQSNPTETTSTKKLKTKENKKPKKFDNETESRTVFVGNLPNTTKKEDLSKIFKSYGKIDSIRFRNIVPEDVTKSKKYAFITHQHHPSKQTINAFIRFVNQDSASDALQLNGTEFRSHHIRVDLANKSKFHDNKRSIFLGGLPFTISEESIREHFKECGEIENIRVIRDNKTGIGKGIGYVTFKTSDSINLALKLNKSEIDNRKVRVERCSKKPKKKDVKKKLNNNKTNKNNVDRNRTKRSSTAESDNRNERIKKSKTDKRFKKINKNPLKNIKTNKKPSTKLRI